MKTGSVAKVIATALGAAWSSTFLSGSRSSCQEPPQAQQGPSLVLVRTSSLPCADNNKDSLLPNEKLVYFVRHAEGEHNAAARVSRLAYLRPDLLDAPLTQSGEAQCRALSERAKKLAPSAQLLVVSPLTRTMRTAELSFPHLLHGIPWVALEEVRERSGLHPCDQRRSKTHYKSQFPMISFDLLESEEDPIFGRYLMREPDEDVLARARNFLRWLAQRPEREIIVVSHDAYLRMLFTKLLSTNENESSFEKFDNCEMRAVVLAVESTDDSNSNKQ